ncbi:MAG: 4-hydroxy-tetrahydrodipicolinate reductase [Bacteroidales bacterium]|jgi:4-hydroxy-tetrahydrodipicolinate reductase|nr:4-hydroxy-tetrahydrodipicolinate reductase [Bacteroidales bacterium]
MKVAIIGYGKMGHMIEATCLERGHEIALVVDKANQNDLNSENLSRVDAAIDFSTPDSAFDNIMKCIEANTPIVSGTTGWLNRKSEIENACKANNASFFYASNFSIGVNLLFAINQKLARLMDGFDNYQCEIEETHHIHKLDAPSGTAISLADDIVKNIRRLDKWKLAENTEINRNDLQITAIREGEVTGKHTITYESNVDTISLSHEAKNRKGFALGAVMAAEFSRDKKGIYTMQDMLAI